ncbi:conserved protein of unknown function(containing Glyco_trans_1_3 domain,17-142;containingUDP-Glycosyltransferase/glycogen phosphorylase domain,9-358) [Magnetospirillum sp. XM-1]|uniref:hypothetical protein n=1 Tax=Magnetospirillum sp. XM-1 TaxID=1663591 RepID=UPI00073DCF68|nr:hypothetical protein [Magnetospirillum sp. XM-1]CUW40205.1 conserved protein of unknown function(containing Glyco_trans_1_3 domain,17-142;containingUDP-Glycosyltransferase/glycogen phosphorylase domain,9-358) [Magnetospirillum sp. XM-1]
MPHPSASKHLWLALSPHGYGHAAMTAPVIAALRRRRPDLRLTIQTAVPRTFLEERYGPDFDYVAEIPDFGLKMLSATRVDLDASAAAYRDVLADFDRMVEAEAERLRHARPDAVLANVPFVTLAAAARAGIPAVALSSLNWADIYRRYLGDRPEADSVWSMMRESYNSAQAFLRVTPAMDMPSLDNVVDIGTVARRGRNRREELAKMAGQGRVGLVAFGGIDHDLDMAKWPRLEGWVWISAQDCPPGRDDIRPLAVAGLPFSDLAASVDVIVTKPGYGTFSEAGLSGTPVLYVARPDWPESPAMDDWLMAHTKALAVSLEDLLSDLETQLQRLFSLPEQRVGVAEGNEQAAEFIESMLSAGTGICERS